MERLDRLVLELCKLPRETAWVEFKHDNYNPEMIGQDIAALANGAALYDKEYAYMIWGVRDEDHAILGTNYNLQNLQVGRQELECWLRMLLSDNVEYSFFETEIEGKHIGILCIRRAFSQTAAFKKVEYVRVGSYTKKLADVPALRAQLWDKIRKVGFENLVCVGDLSPDRALGILDYDKYFKLIGREIPLSSEAVLYILAEEGIVLKQENGLYAVTNLGALLFARDLDNLPNVSRKSIRVVQYDSNNRAGSTKEYIGHAGYVVDFEWIMQTIDALTPSRENIVGALRQNMVTYPSIAIREIIANALIHQDFSVSGAGPLVEIFVDRIEVTNPGIPLVRIERIIDNPPKSRNEKLATCMRRMHMCEELGTGWDKIVISCEAMNLPAPKITEYDNSTKVSIFRMMPYGNISYEDKLWACYLHACIKWVQNEHLTNKSMRERFGVKSTNISSISRLIKAAVEKQIIKPFDPGASPKNMSYIPFWA